MIVDVRTSSGVIQVLLVLLILPNESESVTTIVQTLSSRKP